MIDLPKGEVIKLKKQLKMKPKIHKSENAIESKLSTISGCNILRSAFGNV